jgi:membrane protein implicated in regulation of membrane protease activity
VLAAAGTVLAGWIALQLVYFPNPVSVLYGLFAVLEVATACLWWRRRSRLVTGPAARR